MKKTKIKNIRQAKDLIKVLLGLPSRIEILGFYKGKPIIHDPEHPVADGIVYFINESNFEIRKK